MSREGTNHSNLRGYEWEKHPCPHCGVLVAVNMYLLATTGQYHPIRHPHYDGKCKDK